MNDQQAFLNRLIDLADQADRRGRVTATSFLTPAEQAVAGRFLRNRGISYSFAGGHADAERTVMSSLAKAKSGWFLKNMPENQAMKQMEV